MQKKIIVGIDEVGRGSLAGPVSVGIVVCRRGFELEGVRDSKVMTEAARLRVHALAREAQVSRDLAFGVYSVSATKIDVWGIERALAAAISHGLRDLEVDPTEVEVLLDGRLKAPKEFAQESIIRGDTLVPAISLASVVAKVERDRYMSRVAHKKFPAYGFSAHKGYGTASHIRAIRLHGVCPLHRSSFLRNIVVHSEHD